MSDGHSEQTAPDPAAPDTERAADEEPSDGGDTEGEDDHLDGLEPGAGCTEIWEHLSEQRE